MPKITVKIGKAKFDMEVIDSAGESVAAEIFKYREYRRAEQVIVDSKLPIIDVGAHVGLFSAYCRALNSAVKIVAIEPERKNFSTLNDNVQANKLVNILTINAALSGENGRRELMISADSHNHALFGSSQESRVVSARTLTSIMDELQIKKAGLVKMDIEGGEGEVLRSLSSEDFARVEYFILEYHEKIVPKKELENIFRVHGYGVQIFPSKFDKTMGFIFAHNKRFN
ncbi:MAG: FkbM family methyltransferase [Patescibacteria group bacterium]